MAKKSGGKSKPAAISHADQPPAQNSSTKPAGYSRGLQIGTFLVLLAVVAGGWYLFRGNPKPIPAASPSLAPAHYVGGKSCVGCHAEQTKAWTGSDHDLAMQVADSKSVLGNFDNASFSYAGVTSRFFKRDGKYFVRTDGPDGALADFEIKYTFGVRPLQQYLIEMPGGRLQAFGIAWDARERTRGGQRWYHLYPKDALKAGDALHWTGVNQNWNFMCSECHSTALEKKYDAKQEVFHTTWKELNVSCEACHGPASNHLTWAQHAPAERDATRDKGLMNPLNERRSVNWTPSSGETAPQRRPELSATPQAFREQDTCSRCHGRASRISNDYVHGQPPLDTHIPALIVEGLYWNDGQQRDEVFTTGSFAQSKMHAKGVTCSNCHEPHSLKLRAPGNAVCTQCHAAEKFDAPAHTHHAAATPAAACTACHMPTTTYMGVDPRHDHSMRIPRPDVSEKFGIAAQPNACNGCHDKKTAAWAAAAIRGWTDKTSPGFQPFAMTFHRAALGEPGVTPDLQALASDNAQAGIVRASAIERLALRLNPSVVDTMLRGLNDGDAQVRLASVNALANLPPEERRRYLARMLGDPVRAVRTAAARALAGPAENGLTVVERSVFEPALKQYVATLEYNADRPESQMGLGNLLAARGDYAQAEKHFRQALKIDRGFIEGYVNLADLIRARAGGEAAAEQVLRDGLRQLPKNAPMATGAPLHYALGLNLVRQKRTAEAIKALAEAARSEPNNPRYAYVYGIALHSSGDVRRGLAVLEGALTRRSNDVDVLMALAQFSAQAGRQDEALRYVGRLQKIDPQNPQYRQLATQIIGRQAAPQ